MDRNNEREENAEQFLKKLSNKRKKLEREYNTINGIDNRENALRHENRFVSNRILPSSSITEKEKSRTFDSYKEHMYGETHILRKDRVNTNTIRDDKNSLYFLEFPSSHSYIKNHEESDEHNLDLDRKRRKTEREKEQVVDTFPKRKTLLATLEENESKRNSEGGIIMSKAISMTEREREKEKAGETEREEITHHAFLNNLENPSIHNGIFGKSFNTSRTNDIQQKEGTVSGNPSFGLTHSEKDFNMSRDNYLNIMDTDDSRTSHINFLTKSGYSYVEKIEKPRMDISRIDTSRMGTSRMDTSRMDTSRMDMSRMDASRMDTSRMDMSRMDTSRMDTSRMDTSRMDFSRNGNSRLSTSQIENIQLNSSRVENSLFNSTRLGNSRLLNNVCRMEKSEDVSNKNCSNKMNEISLQEKEPSENMNKTNVSTKTELKSIQYYRIFNMLNTTLSFLPFSLHKYIIGTLGLKEIIDSKYNNCFQLYDKEGLMKYIYENEPKNLVDNKVYNLFKRYRDKKNQKGIMNHLHIFNLRGGNTTSKTPCLEKLMIEKSKILIYKVHSFIEGRDKNLSYIYEICYGLSYRSETFSLAVFIFDYYIHKINEITEKNHYKKVKLVVIISAILLALIQTENSVSGEKMFLSDILTFLNERKSKVVRYTCIQIANKQMEILKVLPKNYSNYWSFTEITYIYLINLKNAAEKYPTLKLYYNFLEIYGFLYFLYDVIYGYSMYITSVGSYKLIPPSRIVAAIILYFSNAFFNKMNTSLTFQEMFCQEVFSLSFVNDVYMWSYLFLDNFLIYFENCNKKNSSSNYAAIYKLFLEAGRIMDITTVF